MYVCISRYQPRRNMGAIDCATGLSRSGADRSLRLTFTRDRWGLRLRDVDPGQININNCECPPIP